MEDNVKKKSDFNHDELVEITTTALDDLLAQDDFLNDLPKGVVLEEVNNQIALLYGKSMAIHVMRSDGKTMPIIVPKAEGTVSDLKKSIEKYITLQLTRSDKKKRPKLISWRYIWRTYHLRHDGCLLTNNNTILSSLGIKNKSCVEFVKKRKKDR